MFLKRFYSLQKRTETSFLGMRTIHKAHSDVAGCTVGNRMRGRPYADAQMSCRLQRAYDAHLAHR